MTGHPIAIRGKAHGKTIELDEETGLPEGQEVKVTVEPVEPAAGGLLPGEGLRRAFGGWADDAEELDEYLQLNRKQRKQSRPGIEP
jgi:hypothetical protein